MGRVLRGRVIRGGQAEGRALVTVEPISFLGGVDPETGVIVDARHPLAGRDISGQVLVFPTGKGSTVGSYVLYQLARNGHAPAAIINRRCEAIVAVGVIIAGIPTIDQVDITAIPEGALVRIGEEGNVVIGE
jgi:uncharacterized protein